MANEEVKPRYIAELTIGTNNSKVELSEISMEHCIARVSYLVRPYQQGLLQIHTHEGSERISSFNPVKVVVESIRQRTGDVGASFIKLKFRGMVSASQGVVQLLHTQTQALAKTEEPEPQKANTSLRIKLLNCPICHQEDIAFHVLEKRTMITKTNLFGVPQYAEAYPGREFCDYNLLRIAVCPSCFFASNDPNEFVGVASNGKVKSPSFNAGKMAKQWLETKNERAELVSNNLTHFFDEGRSSEQAVLTFDLSVMTSDAMFKIDEERSPRTRNYNPVRKATYYLFVKAELLMNDGNVDEAEKTLNEIMNRLEFLFPLLSGETSIRSAYLLGLINIYFQDYQHAYKYLAFLNECSKNDNVETGTNEYKELKTSLKKLNDVLQNREDFNRTSLNGFDRPY